MKRWFTSDTHFGHQNIIAFAGRPAATVEEHDELLISRWNEVVAPNDVVFHLGDVALGKLDAGLRKLDRLHGRKILIPGNHDRVFSGHPPKYRARFWAEYAKRFEIWPEQVKLMLMESGRVVRLCHFPHAGDSQQYDRHVEMRPPDDRTPLLHGHTHTRTSTPLPGAYHVGVDAHDYYPVPEAEIEAWLDFESRVHPAP